MKVTIADIDKASLLPLEKYVFDRGLFSYALIVKPIQRLAILAMRRTARTPPLPLLTVP
jgi:hypothetical protein